MRGRNPRPALRLVALFGACVFLLTAVAGRLVQLQVVQAEPLESRGAQQRVRRVPLLPRRGTIFDRKMTPLAVASQARAVFADPRLVENPAEEALRLSPILGVAPADLVLKLTKPTSFVYLARDVPLDIADKITELDLPYIGMIRESRRVYPSRTVAGQVLGFVGVDDEGLSGIEVLYDEALRGRPGEQILERDPNGTPIPQGRHSIVEPVPGQNVVLTIDRDLQFNVEQALARGAKASKARDGVAIVLDPKNGDVLAMANWPPVDPNRYRAASPEVQRNRAVSDAYEPGSVCKVLTAAAAIDAGLATAEERLNLGRSIRIGDKSFRDLHYIGKHATYAKAIAESSNIATIKVAQRLGPRKLYKAITDFGLARPTGIGFRGESAGILPPVSQWSGTSMGTIPIGQGIAASPLQVAQVYATLANDGVRVTPRLVRGFVGPDGALEQIPPEPAVRVVRPYTAAQVRAMLVGVVEHGTGRRAQIPGYLVGGKTGTARIPLVGARGYSRDIITTFAGMAPADKPRYVVLVALNNPRPRLSALTAAPIFKEITQFALAHGGVEPTVRVHESLESLRAQR